jgi:hypothetical protein
MAEERDTTDPSQTSALYELMAPRWELINSLLGGTEVMRAAGETYLPRHEEESDLDYQERLATAVLLNMVEHTLETLVGKPFSEPIVASEDLPQQIADLFQDIDQQGNNLDVFCRAWFREGLAKAHSHVVVEFPRKAGVKNLAQERAAGLRPYWVAVRPENLLAARYVTISGVKTLVHARILETYTEVEGFSEVTKQRIRVMEPGVVRLYTPVKVKGSNKVKWTVLDGDEWLTGLEVVPLVTFATHPDKPRLLDLAHLNVAHWQSYSDQRHVMTVARFPLLACSGSGGPNKDGSDDITIGPNKVLYSPDPQGRYYYVEHTGAAIEAGRKELGDLESQMANYGAQFLKKRPGSETATAAALDSAEASSELEAMTYMFCDAVAQALSLTAAWLRITGSSGTISLTTDWSGEEINTKDPVGVLQQARKDKDISREAYVNALKDMFGLLPENYDVDKDLELINKDSWRNVTPQDLQQILALAQADKLTFSEVRALLKKASLATLSDEAAKDEMEQDTSSGPGPNAVDGVPPGTPMPVPPTVSPTPVKEEAPPESPPPPVKEA